MPRFTETDPFLLRFKRAQKTLQSIQEQEILLLPGMSDVALEYRMDELHAAYDELNTAGALLEHARGQRGDYSAPIRRYKDAWQNLREHPSKENKQAIRRTWKEVVSTYGLHTPEVVKAFRRSQ